MSCKILRCDSWPGTHKGKHIQGNRPVLQLDLYSHKFFKPYTFHNYNKKFLIKVWKLGNESFANSISLRPVFTNTHNSALPIHAQRIVSGSKTESTARGSYRDRSPRTDSFTARYLKTHSPPTNFVFCCNPSLDYHPQY